MTKNKDTDTDTDLDKDSDIPRDTANDHTTFPNHVDKHGEEAVTTPEKGWEYRKRVGTDPDEEPPETVIFCFSSSLAEHIRTEYETVGIDTFVSDLDLIGSNREVGVASNLGIGAPVTATVMEALIQWGVQRFLVVGYAGALKTELDVGDTVIAEKAIRDEGTSHHYLEPAKYAYPTPEVLEGLKNSIEFDYVGPTWTVDAPHRETPSEVEKYREEGVLTVEMEASALFTVAEFRDVEAGAVFTVSDHLTPDDWEPGFRSAQEDLFNLFDSVVEGLKMF